MTASKFEFLTLDRKPCPPGQAPARFGFECPNRPGEMCRGLLIETPENAGKAAPSWAWNGNREAPTFRPSIMCQALDDDGSPCAGCGFHGFITDGVIKSV